MSDQSIFHLRFCVHEVLDPLWQDCIENGGYRESRKRHWRRGGGHAARKLARERVYAWLGEKLGLSRAECHVKLFTEEQCHEAIWQLEGVTYRDIRMWVRRQEKMQLAPAAVEHRA